MNNYIEKHRDRFLNELLDLLRIPSVSADSKFKPDMLRAAEYVKDRIKEAGADRVEIYETPGHPVVYGEKIIDAGLPTVLIYGHYDVQPADPYELWNSPPFEPVIKNDRIFARGACDDKGQFYMHIKALETMLATGSLACNVKIMIEGEEEIGSSHLETFVKEHREMLKCDTILISDTSIIANDVPSIETGLRGLTYVEVEVIGANRDLHSGVYGGGVANPINILCDMISSLKDENGHITIPGFYDNVQDLTTEERNALNSAPFDLDEYKKDLQVDDVTGEAGYTTIERTSVRPTLDVNGIWGGYIGEGAKTVLPSKASAKVSMRLVPNQTDQEICALFTKHFESIAPASVKVKVTPHHGGLPYVTPTDSIEYKAAEMAMEESFGKKPIPTRGGGSIPIVALFEQELGRKSILMGFGLDIDALHSPNESYGLFNYYKGIETIPLFFKHYAELKSKK
ncbi:dipeptidase [Dyadobacter sp. NIV53]|uniref:dipeptidase n=1 Tax=Dyadobacter sp. NIV53 TaxID=2861765 RepID=UPI001C856EC7|nr:dipeptidase [Dyadobacter sp. NIV53]